MGIESTHNDPVKTEYRVKYGEDEETWVFDLLHDLQKNDLIIYNLYQFDR